MLSAYAFYQMHVVIPWTWLYNAHCFIQKWTHCCCFCIGYVTGTWEGRLTKIIKHAAYYGLYPLVVCSGDKEPVASPRGGLGWTCPPHFCSWNWYESYDFLQGRGRGVKGRLQTPVIGSRSTLSMSVHPTYFDLTTPLQRTRVWDLRDQDLRLRFNTLVSAKIMTLYLG